MHAKLTDAELFELARWALACAPLAENLGSETTRAAERVERLIYEVREHRAVSDHVDAGEINTPQES